MKNRKLALGRLWLFACLVLGLSCGVNTGNPTSQQVKFGKTGTSLFLGFKKLNSGTLKLQVSRVLLIPKDQDVNGAGSVTLSFAGNASFSSGQTISLASQEAIPAGLYNRVALILNKDNPATFISEDALSTPVAIAPYQYYESAGLQATDSNVQLVLTLPSDAAIEGALTKALDLSTDLSPNLQGFEAIEAGAYDYYKNKGELNYQYTLKPNAELAVASVSSDAAFLNVIVNQSPLPIQFVCLYKKAEVPDPTTYINDLNCAQASYLAEVSLARSQDLASFAVSPGAYLVLGRNPDLALVYQVEVILEQGEQWNVDIATGSVSRP